MSKFEFALASPADDAQLRQRTEDWMASDISVSVGNRVILPVAKSQGVAPGHKVLH